MMGAVGGRLIRWAETRVRARQALAMKQLAERLSAAVKNASVTIEDGAVVMSGKGLNRRFLDDPSLRFLGGKQ